MSEAWTLGTAYTCALCGSAVLGHRLLTEHLKLSHYTNYKAYRCPYQHSFLHFNSFS